MKLILKFKIYKMTITERNQNRQEQERIRKANETEEYNLRKVGLNIGKQIRNARETNKWTQKQLANKMFKPVSIIISHENGTALHDSKILEQFKRVLNIKSFT